MQVPIHNHTQNRFLRLCSKALFFFFCAMLWFVQRHDLRMFILNLNLLSFEKYIHKLWGELVLQFYQTLKHRRYFPLLFSFVFLCMLLRNKKLKWILQIQLFDSKSILSSIFRGNLRSCFLLIIFISQFLPWDKNKQTRPLTVRLKLTAPHCGTGATRNDTCPLFPPLGLY